MTALEALYNRFLEKKMEDRFYDTFRDDCPTTFFKGLNSLCNMNEDGTGWDEDKCCKCWLQEVDIHHKTKVHVYKCHRQKQ